jgi:hypothetical protein
MIGVHTINEMARRRVQAAKLPTCKDAKPGTETNEEGQGRSA